jgi:hypothetical protein
MLAGGGRNRVPELGASGSGEMTLTRHFVPGYFQSPLPKNPARNLKRPSRQRYSWRVIGEVGVVRTSGRILGPGHRSYTSYVSHLRLPITSHQLPNLVAARSNPGTLESSRVCQ